MLAQARISHGLPWRYHFLVNVSQRSNQVEAAVPKAIFVGISVTIGTDRRYSPKIYKMTLQIQSKKKER
jgi:hypothetical protein